MSYVLMKDIFECCPLAIVQRNFKIKSPLMLARPPSNSIEVSNRVVEVSPDLKIVLKPILSHVSMDQYGCCQEDLKLTENFPVRKALIEPQILSLDHSLSFCSPSDTT